MGRPEIKTENSGSFRSPNHKTGLFDKNCWEDQPRAASSAARIASL